MAPLSTFFLLAVEKLIADHHPELGWRMRGKDKEQHLERVVVPEEKDFNGWHALTCNVQGWENQGR
jgi:hypothetical protein